MSFFLCLMLNGVAFVWCLAGSFGFFGALEELLLSAIGEHLTRFLFLRFFYNQNYLKITWKTNRLKKYIFLVHTYQST